MAIKATETKQAPANRVVQDELAISNYMCRIAQIIDMGMHHKDEWDAETKKFVTSVDKAPIHKLMLTYEFTTEFMKDKDGVDLEDKPRWLSETFALYPKTIDRAISTARYNALDPKNDFGGDWGKLADIPCTVTIAHKKSGKAKIGNVSPPMKGIPVPELKNPVKVFDLSDPDLTIFQSLPQWLQDDIKKNLEFEGSLLQRKLAGGVVEEPVEEDVEEDQVADENPW